ncbi:uncharacterized protein LOC110450040 [Mizuhopecten yessoensis]|uniref:uncharacterized protein LOC110450040 n=1 Tax=Mizuhopecten yessoensis TaxID=6573 RepID=UPI000B458050|nr:uncharacterized protein LOC110450040 [Mizuhopecten yessoensis]
MAEADPIQQLDSREISIFAGLTDCPICLNQLECPKSLPCLHTFCKECLDTFIVKHASDTTSVPVSFPCPMCRRETQPVDASVSRTRWAEQYPKNNLILAILDMKDLQLSNKICKPCQKKHKLEKEATVWCRNCNMFLCDDCRIDHDFYIEGHTILTSKEVETDPTKTIIISTKCESHEETMKLFCRDHEVVCCSTCVAVEHRKCDNVVTVKEQAKNLKERKQAMPILTSMSKDIRTLDGLLNDSQTNIDELLNDKKGKISDMSQFRKQIDARLDYLQKGDAERLEVAVEKQQVGIKSRMKSVNNLKSAIEQSQKQIRAAEICLDDAQLVMTVQKVSAAREAYQQMVEENVSLQKRHKIDVHMIEAVKGLFDMSTLIKVDDESRIAVDPFKWCKKARLTHRIQMTPNSRTTGILYLGADSIVTVDYNNCMLSCHSTGGNLKFHLKLEEKPWDVCKMDDNGIAVTIPGKKIIALVKVMDNDFSVTGNIQVKRKCYGIACIEKRFVVTCANDQEVLVLSSSGQILCNIIGNSHMWHAISAKGSKNFIVSERRGNQGKITLHRLDEKKTMSSFFQSESVSGGRGMGADEFGNIYVCAIDDNSVLMVSPTGQSKSILSKEDGLNQPCAIGVHDDKIIVFEEGNVVGKVFQLLA